MALHQNIILNSDLIFRHVPEENIWAAYYGEIEFKKAESSRFRVDDNPSCGFYVNKAGKIIYNDIATGEKLDCFAFVAKENHITYKQALQKVASDFGLLEGSEKKFDKSTLKKIEKVVEEKIIEIVPDTWDKSYLSFWDRFFVTKEELIREGVYPLKAFSINGVTIPNYSKNIRFAYELKFNNKTYYKIYAPFNDRFKWLSNIPLHIPFGITNLPCNDSRCFITKSQKERLIWLKYFDDVIAIQSESPSALRDQTIKWLKKRYKELYILMDNDEAGQRASQYYEDKGLLPIYVPKDGWGTKDWGEYVEKYGLRFFEKMLSLNRLI